MRRGNRGRPLVLALLALAVPLPALALTDGKPEPAVPAHVEMAVSASLGKCGLAETQIVCQINASWDAVEDADYYTVSVTRPDGSVVDYGETGSPGTSLWVPYVGSGTYSVEVAAWGTPEDDAEPRVIARDHALSTADGRNAQRHPPNGPTLTGDPDADGSEGDHSQAGETPSTGEAPPPPEDGEEAEAPAEAPCEEAELPTSAEGDADTLAAPSAEGTAAADAPADSTAGEAGADGGADTGAVPDPESDPCL